MKTTEYILEIYEPESFHDTLVSFSARNPFLNINIGDIINPGTWLKSQSPIKVLRVVGREHIIWQTNEKIKHKLCIYTEEVDRIIVPDFEDLEHDISAAQHNNY